MTDDGARRSTRLVRASPFRDSQRALIPPPLRFKHSRMLAPAAILLVLLVRTAIGQNVTRITLDQAIDLALEHNHSIKATRTLVLQNRGTGDHCQPALLIPHWEQMLSSILLFSPSNFSTEYLDESQQFDIGVGYLFERGHKRQRRLQAAQDQTDVTRAQVADAERTLTFNVGQQFVSVLLAESTLQFSLQDLQSFQQTVDISDAQLKAGAIGEGDYLKIKLQLLQFP